MSISITNVRSATAGEWDITWSECDHSTYFHSREWAEIWTFYSKGKICPAPILITFSDGKKALLPLSLQKNLAGFRKKYLSSPAGTFGGWISTHELSVEHADLLTHYLTQKIDDITWRLNPYDHLALKAHIRPSKFDETHALHLAGGFDTIYKGWTKGHRSAARKAQQHGVTIEFAYTLDDWYSYYQVYEDSLQRWGNKASSVYKWALFNEMLRRNSPYIKLWLAIYQDKVVAGALCFYAKKHAVYWHGAALKDYFHLRPINLLMYEAIKDACERGYAWFDFNPSGKHTGVKAFKKSFGANTLQSNIYSHPTGLEKVSRWINRWLSWA